MCPKNGKDAGLVLPDRGAGPTNPHLAEISLAVDPGAHAVPILDRAGWHVTPGLAVPANTTRLFPPP